MNPGGYNVSLRVSFTRTRRWALERGDQCANRKAEQGTATDSAAVGDYVAKFHGAAG